MKEVSREVAAIVVTYQPNLEQLLCLVKSLSDQVSTLYIVDNGSSTSVEHFSQVGVKLICLQENMGIAFAQNVGINTAIEDGFEDFVLFDQDSLPSDSMMNELFMARDAAEAAGIKVAAVGPVHIDHDSLVESFFIRSGKSTIAKVTSPSAHYPSKNYAECDFLISSGCLVSKPMLDEVGGMEERLFIDCVDIEWGFRALGCGYSCVAAFDAKMYHKIGEKPIKLFGREFTTHSPIRHYYFYRNFYHLLKRKYVPMSWKRHVFIKSIAQAIIFCTFLPPRKLHFKLIVMGIIHGLGNKYGQYK